MKGKQETFGIQTVDSTLPGVDRTLVILGSDQRGTIYGKYYHIDYLGPESLTVGRVLPKIERIPDQMTLTYQSGVDQL